MRLIGCLVNEMSGSVPVDGGKQLKGILEKAGFHVALFKIENGKLKETLDALSALAADCVVVWGGDGTVNAVLDRFRDKSTPVIAMPGGTMNLLHKRCDWGDLKLEDLPTLLGTGIEKELVLGSVGHEPFSVALMAGALTGIAGPREALRQGDVIGAIAEVVVGGALNLKNRIQIESWRAGLPLEVLEATAVAVFITDEGDFEVGAITPGSLLDLAGTGFEALVDDWRTATGMTYLRADRVTLSSLDDQPIPARLDGEALSQALVYEIELCPQRPTILTWESA